jgi:hypothetical protein
MNLICDSRMSTAANANGNAMIMQPQLQSAHSQQLSDHTTRIITTASLLLVLSFFIFINCLIHGGWKWKLLAVVGPLSIVHALCTLRYISLDIENSAEERIWRCALSLLQLATGAAYPACMHMTKNTTQMSFGWFLFAIFFLQAVLTVWVPNRKYEFGEKTIHPVPAQGP